jgi:hypothetical protein
VVSNLTLGRVSHETHGLLAVGAYQSGHKAWARYILKTTQSGAFTGEADVITYGGHGQYVEDVGALIHVEGPAVVIPKRWVPAPPLAWRVAICNHQIVGTGTQAQSQRGWHRAHCAKCGMDLSVDSGD